MGICKSLNINSETVMKTPKILKFIPGPLKTKEICKHAVKKLPYLLRYVPDQYNTVQMCDEAIFENGATLKSVPNYYKSQEMCNKAVDNYSHAIEFAPECYKTQKIYDEAVDDSLATLKLIPDWFVRRWVKHLKKDKWRINSNSVALKDGGISACQKMRKKEIEEIEPIFTDYCFECIQFGSISALGKVQKSLLISSHFHTQRRYLVQKPL